MALIVVGVGSLLMVIANPAPGIGVGVLGIAMAFGLIVMALIYTIGPISGCHINPAVTIGVMAIKGMKPKDGLMYIVFQLIGAVIGGAILYYLVWDTLSGAQGLSGTELTDGIQGVFSAASNGYWVDGATGSDANRFLWSLPAVFLLELLIAFVLQLVILGSLANKENKALAGVAIGFTVTALLIVAAPADNAGLNPLRALAPAIFAGSGFAINQLWLFFVAPIVGAILGSFIFAWFAKPAKA
jgi:aquaporin Z